MYYRKYRPQVFSEISKPNDVAVALSNQIKSGKTVHAYLFVGPRGTGKTTTARVLAKALNCIDLKDNGDPCDACDHCVAIKSGSFYDLIEIDAASNRGIDDIRELKEKIKLAPSAGKNKVYIIDEVHMLTPEAFNALLKTLEEPPANVTFILCTTEIHKVPATIKSRCQVFKIKRATVDQLSEKLMKIVEKESIKIDEQDIRQIAKASHGGFRDAETILQQVAEGEVEVNALISVIDKEVFAEFVDLVIANDAKQALHIVKKLNENGIDLYLWAGELLKYLRDLLFVQVDSLEDIQDYTEELIKDMKVQANSMSAEKLAHMIDVVMEAQNNTKNTFITQLPLEIAVVKLCSKKSNNQESQVTQTEAPSSPALGGPSSVKKDEKASKEDVKEEKSSESDTPENKVEVPAVVEVPVVGVVNIEIINNSWHTVITEVGSINNSVSALLKTAKLAGVDGRAIQLDVPFDFHKERLETNKNRMIIEQILSSVLHEEMHIKCNVRKQDRDLSRKETGRLTDYNVAIPSKTPVPEMNEKLLDVFDGGLPLE
ncbi:DNA polymerase III subunit gamma/tau [Patescibacteria group bacterium]